MDTLHVLHLGVCKLFCSFALWALITADAWAAGETNDNTLLELSVMRLRMELFAWYKDERRRNPTQPLQELQNLTAKMLGTRTRPSLATKGAETGTLLRFVADLLRKRQAALGAQAEPLLGAGEALVLLQATMHSSPAAMGPAAKQQLVGAATRAFVLCKAAGVPLTPKFHLMLHLVSRVHMFGNPTCHSTFVDEGYNGRLATLACTLHRRTFYKRVLANFRAAFSRTTQRRLR